MMLQVQSVIRFTRMRTARNLRDTGTAFPVAQHLSFAGQDTVSTLLAVCPYHPKQGGLATADADGLLKVP